jgi:hypothetical protein
MDTDDTHIAIVGMAAHLPGAPDVGSYWTNLREGRSAVRRLTEEELIAAGESPAMLKNPAYVPFAAPLDGFDRFDAEFFGFSPKEAAILDPQHRHFSKWRGRRWKPQVTRPNPSRGASASSPGCGMGSYFYFNLCSTGPGGQHGHVPAAPYRQRQGFPVHPRQPHLRPEGAVAFGPDGLFDLARRRPLCGAGAAERRMRHGACGRRDHRTAAEPGIHLQGRRSAFPRWRLPCLRPSRSGHRFRLWRGHRRAPPPGRCRRGWRSYLGRDPGQRRQQ